MHEAHHSFSAQTAIALVLAIAAWGAPAPYIGLQKAHAACLPDPAIFGADVTCSADDPDGYTVFLPGAFDLSSFTVEDDVTVSAFPAPFGPFAVIFIDGTVETFVNDGIISAGGGDQAAIDVGAFGTGGFTNTGTILGSGSAPGIFVFEDIEGPFINTATGSIAADDAPALFVGGDIFSIENAGEFIGGAGVVSLGDIGSLTTSGTIFGDFNAIEALNIGTLVNTGLIDSFGDGVDVDGFSSVNDPTSEITLLINSGIIQGDDDGIDVGTLVELRNSGTITGDFEGDGDGDAIAAANISSIINSGRITTSGDFLSQYAIQERGDGSLSAGGATALTLNAGSILIGRVDLGGGTNTLNIGSGLSLNSTFDGESADELPVFGETSGSLFAFDDGPGGAPFTRQMVAVDQSVFSTLDDTVFNLLSGIDSTLSDHVTHPIIGDRVTNPELDGTSSNEPEIWVRSFSGLAEVTSDDGAADVDHWWSGIVGGVSAATGVGGFRNAYVGAAVSGAEAEDDTHEHDTLSVYAGFEQTHQRGALMARWGLTGGILWTDQDRRVANNLVATGLETANADYRSFFISPNIGLTSYLDNPYAGSEILGWTLGPYLEPSVSLRYTALFSDGYTESGTSSPLTLNARRQHLATARTSVALPFEREFSSGLKAKLRLSLGAELQSRLGSEQISGVLLGQAVSTDIDEDNTNFAGIIGATYQLAFANGMSAYAKSQSRFEIDGDYGVQVQIGVRGAF